MGTLTRAAGNFFDVKVREAGYVLEFIRHRQSADAFVISFPKAGRTWHRVLLGYCLSKACGEPVDKAFRLTELCRKIGAPRVVYSHDGANFNDGLPPSSHVVASPLLWQRRRVLFLVRDPRDVLVSAYHHAHFRNRAFAGSLSEFIRAPTTGIAKVMTAHQRWYENRHRATVFTVVSYEQLHRAPQAALKASLSLLDLHDISDELIAEAVDFARIDRMREYEDTNFFNHNSMKRSRAEPEARKVREGRAGGFLEHFAPSDVEYVDQYIARVGGDPYSSYYVQVGTEEAPRVRTAWNSDPGNPRLTV